MTDWQSIVDEHGGLVWRISYRLLGNDADAADCFQETFISAMKTAQNGRVRSFAALLSHIASARAIDRLRQRSQRSKWQVNTAELGDIESSDPGPAQQVEAQELAENLRIALARLPSKEAEAFYLKNFEGFSYRQIGKQLGVKTSAVGVYVHRAKMKLRQLLEKSEGRFNNEE